MTLPDATGEGVRLLWLLRHAKAAADPPRSGNDHDRPLAPRGRRDATALGLRLASGELGFSGRELPAIALCSTARRTTETAERVTAALAVPIDRRRRLYYGAPADLLAEVWSMDDAVPAVLLVGHNPAIHTLALDVLSPDDAGRDAIGARGFPTCALAVCRLAGRRWRDVTEGTGRLAAFVAPPY